MDQPAEIPTPLSTREYAITIIIPTFNRATALMTCLKHLEQQTYKNFEVLVVDDGSTDATTQMLQEYGRTTPLALRFFQQQNSGPARARNVAIAAALSPVVLMIGDDIFATPQLIETHLKLHQQRPERRVAGLGLTVWQEKNQRVTRFMRFLEEGTQFAYGDLAAGQEATGRQGYFYGAYFYTSNLSAKTELLRRNPFCERFPAAAFEDLELGYRLARTEGLELVFIPEALAHHYHPTTFLQGCRRMRRGGWSLHLLYEIWPEIYNDPAGKTALRRTVRKILAPAYVLLVATYISAALSRFCSPKALFRAVLGTHLYLGYQDRERQLRAGKDTSPANQKGASLLNHKGHKG